MREQLLQRGGGRIRRVHIHAQRRGGGSRTVEEREREREREAEEEEGVGFRLERGGRVSLLSEPDCSGSLSEPSRRLVSRAEQVLNTGDNTGLFSSEINFSCYHIECLNTCI